MKFSGGLGNQLFQFATGREVALANSLELRGEFEPLSLLSRLRGVHRRTRAIEEVSNNFALPQYFNVENVESSVPADGQQEAQKGSFSEDLAGVALGGLPLIHEPALEQGIFNPQLIDRAKAGGILSGHWQSPRYFDTSWEFFNRAIVLASSRTAEETAIWETLKHEKSICVHVRRGDYAKSKIVKKRHGLLSTEFFELALETVLGSSNFESVWFFSEDVEYCKEKIRVPKGLKTRYVSKNQSGLTDAAQLRLMSKFEQFVISNSTYGWWAAWASGSNVVAYPRQWSRGLPDSYTDLIPRHWRFSVESAFVL